MKVNITYIIRKDEKTLHTFEDPEEAIEKFIAIRNQESEKHEKILSRLGYVDKPYIVAGSIVVRYSENAYPRSYYLETKIEELEQK